MFRRILIPTDFSTAAGWAFDEAVNLAACHGAELVVLHVRMTKPSHPDELRFPFDASLYEYAEQQELQRLRHRVAEARADLATRLIVRRAPEPAAEIARTAVDEGVDLLVVSTHGSHHVAHLIVGSTTESLLKDPPAPMLVIRYGTRKREGFDRLVVPVSEIATPALALARDLARDLHVIARNDPDALRRELPAATVVPLQGSDLGKEVVRYAAEVDADAIVLEARRGDAAATLDVVRYAPVPVMVVPVHKGLTA